MLVLTSGVVSITTRRGDAAVAVVFVLFVAWLERTFILYGERAVGDSSAVMSRLLFDHLRGVREATLFRVRPWTLKSLDYNLIV